MARFHLEILLIVLLVFAGACATTGDEVNGTDPQGGSVGGQESSSAAPGWVQNIVNALVETAADVVEDRVDKAVGKYDGKIVKAELLEQSQEAFIFEVHYNKVKNPAETFLKAEALKGGYVQSHFFCQEMNLQHESGSLIVFISIGQAPSYQYGSSGFQVDNPDQFLFYLYHSEKPEKRFGQRTIGIEDSYAAGQQASSYPHQMSPEPSSQSPSSGSMSSPPSGSPQSASGPVFQGLPGKRDTGKTTHQQTDTSPQVQAQGTVIQAKPLPKPPVAPVLMGKSLEHDIDRPGKDIRSFTLSSPDPNMCREECLKDPKCRAFTYVKPGVQSPQAKCWLKNGVPSQVKNTNCISGVVRP